MSRRTDHADAQRVNPLTEPDASSTSHSWDSGDGVTAPTTTARCCIAGGGPAGVMLGLLLARAGIDVLVLEKHADFLRDFRGDTIHPSTLEVMHELGLLDRFLALPHERVYRISAQVGDVTVPVADFDRLPTRCRFIAFMPQWDFLNFLAEEGRRHATFRLWMRAEVTGLIEESGRVAGLEVRTARRPSNSPGEPGGRPPMAARPWCGSGRGSRWRSSAPPIDVLWFRLSRRPDDQGQTMGRFDTGRIFIMINRGEHWQCGYVIAKGSLGEMHRGGLEAFRREVARLAPFAPTACEELRSWDDVKLLTVRVDRARRWWRPGSSASATPPTRCRRSAESGSTSRSKMPSPPPTAWRRPSARIA